MGVNEVNKTVERHDRARMSFRVENQDEFWRVKQIDETSKRLALWEADYKCEKCGTEDNLTQHHLINRKNKYFMGIVKYVRQRRDFRNTAILCRSCHNEADSLEPRDDERGEVLSNEYIKHIKRLLGRKPSVPVDNN